MCVLCVCVVCVVCVMCCVCVVCMLCVVCVVCVVCAVLHYCVASCLSPLLPEPIVSKISKCSMTGGKLDSDSVCRWVRVCRCRGV